jgi:hypothetical protein
LQVAFEAAAGTTLDVYFSQWLERAGAPVLRIESADCRNVDGAYEMVVELAQSEPAYHLEVPIEIGTEKETLARRVVFDAGRRSFTFRIDEPPLHLRVDPDFTLFRRLDPSEFSPILRNVAFAARPAAVIATNDPQADSAARAVATAFFERPPELFASGEDLPDRPILLIGTSGEVAALLTRNGLPAPPGLTEGSARAWAARSLDGNPYAVVQADDAEALRQIAGPLPHYGSQSFIVFRGRRAVERGVWPLTGSPLHVVVENR